MGYACPVCGTPEVDGRHLANHVAFTALTGDAAHETWLDGQVPGWGDLGEDELAERVVPHAEETDVADVFDEGGAGGHDHGTGGRPDVGGHAASTPDLDEEAADVLAEAREYTRQMAEADGAANDAEVAEGADGEEAEGADAERAEEADAERAKGADAERAEEADGEGAEGTDDEDAGDAADETE